MRLVLEIIVGLIAIGFFVWLVRGSDPVTDVPLDADNPRQVGELLGMMGKTIEDAAIAQAALRRFEKERGCKATMRDLGVVAGMMSYLPRSGG